MKYLLLTFFFYAAAVFPFVRSYGEIHIEPIVLVHGGADNLYSLRLEGRKQGVKNAATIGYKVLKNGGSVIDAVEQAVKSMEADGNFNAGYGSALNLDGDVEMGAGIMVGSNATSGAVTGMKNAVHPITVARLVMEKSPHCLLGGEGAKRFAKRHGVPLVPSASLVAPHAKERLAEHFASGQSEVRFLNTVEVGCGGVGAIAVDAQGHVAAAASTGGHLARYPGRTSDASIVGAGFYADDEVGAVVVTGHGESIQKYVLAHEIICAMKRGFDAGLATRNSVKGITEKFHKPTGAISISRQGQVGISFTTEKMAWAYQIRDNVHYGVDDYDHFNEKIKI